jgi:hypothetical protein
MSIMTTAPANGSFASNPNFALGTADAYDEYNAGDTIDTLIRRSHEMLDSPHHSMPAELYVFGYATTVIALYNGHRATVTAQTAVAHTDHAKAAVR